jgi:5'-3' exoribonuclease 1
VFNRRTDIKPGTEFMSYLHDYLKKFIKFKVSSDNLWKIKVFLSGHQVPGEGEHKIIDYFR